MRKVFDCAITALIEAKCRTELQNEVDEAVDNLMQTVKAEKNACCAQDILGDKIGCLMNEEFELGVMCGFQLAVQMMQPLNLR